MKKCMKLENKRKRKGIKVLPAFEDKNLAKDLEENDKTTFYAAIKPSLSKKGHFIEKFP